MRKIILAVIIVGVLLIYFLQDNIINSVKRNLHDQLTINVSSTRLANSSLRIECEHDTILREQIKNGTFSLPRIHGKHRFFLETRDTSIYLDVSYFKLDVWKQTEVVIDFTNVNDSIHVIWRRDYGPSPGAGDQKILLHAVGQ